MKLPYFLVKPAVTLPLLVAVAFALNAPVQWYSSAYWPTSILDLMSAIFPSIAGYAKKSAFPSVTQLYMSFAFMLMPVHSWYAYKELTTPNDQPWFKNLWAIDSKLAFAKRACLVLVMCAIVFFSLFLNPGYDFNLMPLNTSRLALGLGGWIVAGGAQGVCLAWIYCNLVVFVRFLGESKNGSVE